MRRHMLGQQRHTLEVRQEAKDPTGQLDKRIETCAYARSASVSSRIMLIIARRAESVFCGSFLGCQLPITTDYL